MIQSTRELSLRIMMRLHTSRKHLVPPASYKRGLITA